MTQPFNLLLTLDFESRWSSKPTSWSPDEAYTLSKLTTEAYIRDPRFKAFGCCIHEYSTDKPIQWYSHAELPRIFKMYDWRKTAVLAHNSPFDIGILSMVYGVRPCFIFDSLSMARALRGVEVGNSLMKLADSFGLPPKGHAVHSTDGLEELTPEIEHELAEYCKHDVFLCEEIFTRLRAGVWSENGVAHIGTPYPTKELRLISMTVKMFTEPALVLDVDMLEDAVVEEKAKLESALARVGMEESTLASADKFSEALRTLGVETPTKKSKTTGQQIPALAKTDALFQQLLNGDNEAVALLCEARIAAKSTQARTRAQRFIGIAANGALPVPLKYYGAETGRWSAEGAINLQNMKRGSTLRKAIMAPKGHVLCVGDLSQIEPRVLAWLSGYDEMLDIFRSGADPYATFGASMFSIPGLTKNSHPLERQSAKSALLGCFGSRTPVLTKRGWVNIVDVTKEDVLWDGVEWVTHQGVLAQGEKDVLMMYGVAATSDHEILTERGWVEWSEAAANPSLFQSAIALGNLPALDGTQGAYTKSTGGTTCSHGCSAPAGGRGMWTEATYALGEQPAATRVQEKSHAPQKWPSGGLQASAQTLCCATGCSTASAPSLSAAQTHSARLSLTTAAVVSRCILRGWKTVRRSCATLLGFLGTTNSNCNWTAQTTTRGTPQEICASSPEAQIWQTSAASRPEKSLSYADALPPLKQKMQTYDIAMAGPRNRFTILTTQGPIIAHNCGYQLGWASFAAQLLVGFLGAPPVRYSKAEAKQLGVNQTHVDKFLNNADHIKRMLEIPHTCTTQELLIHCLAAKAIVDRYRTTAAPVVELWELVTQRIARSLIGGEEYDHKGVLLFRKEEIVMANGMRLKYPNISQADEFDPETKKPTGRKVFVFGPENKRQKLYSGRIVNNCTQGLARVIMADGLLRVEKRYPVKGTVHDEGIFLVPEAEAEEAKRWVHEQMILEPKWMPGIPLEADVDVGVRYGEIK